MKKTLLAILLLAAAAPLLAAAQECVTCWSEKCPDLRAYAKPCQGVKPAMPAAPSAKPARVAPASTPVGCPAGKQPVGGHCCWPGQDFGLGSGRCIGTPQCGEGMRADGAECVLGCPEGQVPVAGHCCQPGQDWGVKAGRCVGEVAAFALDGRPLQEVTITDFGLLHSTQTLEASERAEVLRQLKSPERLEEVQTYAHERSWPAGVATLDARSDSRPTMARYRFFKVASFGTLTIVAVPAALNRHMPSAFVPGSPMYMLFDSRAVAPK